MGGVAVRTHDDVVCTKLSFSCKRSIEELTEVLQSLEAWPTIFPDYVLKAKLLNTGVDGSMSADLVLDPPLFIKQPWEVSCRYTMQLSAVGILLEGVTSEFGDWPNTRYTVRVGPSLKKGKLTEVELITDTPSQSLPLPPASLTLLLKAVRPLIKSQLDNAKLSSL